MNEIISPQPAAGAAAADALPLARGRTSALDARSLPTQCAAEAELAAAPEVAAGAGSAVAVEELDDRAYMHKYIWRLRNSCSVRRLP